MGDLFDSRTLHFADDLFKLLIGYKRLANIVRYFLDRRIILIVDLSYHCDHIVITHRENLGNRAHLGIVCPAHQFTRISQSLQQTVTLREFRFTRSEVSLIRCLVERIDRTLALEREKTCLTMHIATGRRRSLNRISDRRKAHVLRRFVQTINL